MQSKDNKTYTCKHFKVMKKDRSFTAIEWKEETVYLYEYDGEELRRYTIPKEDFFQMIIEGEIEYEKKHRDKK